MNPILVPLFVLDQSAARVPQPPPEPATLIRQAGAGRAGIVPQVGAGRTGSVPSVSSRDTAEAVRRGGGRSYLAAVLPTPGKRRTGRANC